MNEKRLKQIKRARDLIGEARAILEKSHDEELACHDKQKSIIKATPSVVAVDCLDQASDSLAEAGQRLDATFEWKELINGSFKMAVRQKMPTKTEQKKIARILERVFDEKPQFIPRNRAKQWYGILNTHARDALREEWTNCCKEKGTKAKVLIGEFPNPKGYILVRGDQKWLESL